jgi:hypothetical protein
LPVEAEVEVELELVLVLVVFYMDKSLWGQVSTLSLLVQEVLVVQVTVMVLLAAIPHLVLLRQTVVVLVLECQMIQPVEMEVQVAVAQMVNKQLNTEMPIKEIRGV